VRAYALLRLDEAGEADTVRQRHLEWSRGLAREIDGAMNGRDEARWQAVARDEHLNLVEALHTAAAHPDRAVELAELAGRLRQPWEVVGRHAEALGWLERALAAHQERDLHRLRVLTGLGRLADRQNDWEGAERDYLEALDIARSLGDTYWDATLQSNLAYVRYGAGDAEGSRRWTTEALALAERAGDARNQSRATNMLGVLAIAAGDLEAAERHMRAALELARQLDSPSFIAQILSNLADIAMRGGDIDAAVGWQHEGLELARELGDTELTAIGLVNTAECLLAKGDWQAAHGLLEEAIELVKLLGNKQIEACTLWLWASVLASAAHPADEVLAVAERSVEAARRFGSSNVLVDALLSTAATAIKVGAMDAARPWVVEVAQLATRPADIDRLHELEQQLAT
jgi:tetratricopeptide (TPR) repeat protein